MDAWTALMLHRQTTRELHRGAARHRLATLAAASARTRPSAAVSTSWRRYGARLHRAVDGTWLGYARRPDAEIVIDLLDEPRTT